MRKRPSDAPVPPVLPSAPSPLPLHPFLFLLDVLDRLPPPSGRDSVPGSCIPSVHTSVCLLLCFRLSFRRFFRCCSCFRFTPCKWKGGRKSPFPPCRSETSVSSMVYIYPVWNNGIIDSPLEPQSLDFSWVSGYLPFVLLYRFSSGVWNLLSPHSPSLDFPGVPGVL